MADQKQKLRIIDDPQIRDVYANKYIFGGFDGGAVSLTLGVLRFMPEKTDTGPSPGQHPNVYVTTRLSLSPNAAVELINGLQTILAAMATMPNSPIKPDLPTSGTAN